MYIDIHADALHDAHSLPLEHIRDTLEHTLRALSTQIIRADVQLGQSSRTADRKEQRCCIEARLRGAPSLLVEHQAASLDQAVDGALAKLGRVIDVAGARARDRKWSRASVAAEGAGAWAPGSSLPSG